MKPSAALLIDLENFYLSRIDHFNDEGIRTEDRPSFADDLRNLVRYAHAITKLPFAVRRAYADFDALKVNPQELMRQGVEPVQVFRLSGKTANKNAADMKLAMDAVSLHPPGGPIEHFVLVSGDADFIPVILELKRRGHTVSVIAVTGATNEFIQRFVDHFELFEARQAADVAKPRDRLPVAPGDFPTVAAALGRLLAQSRPVRFNVVQPRLSKELGCAFDPRAFGCDSTGEFLRKHHAALGVVVRGTLNEQEIDLPNAPPGANGSRAPKPAPRQAARPAESAPAPEPHTAAHYRQLLAGGRADANEARVLAVPWAALVWVCDAVVPALTPPTGGPATSIELLPRIQTAARATGVPHLDRYAAQIHAAVRCSLPVPSVEGVYSLHPDTTGEQIRARLLRYVVHALGRRLTESGVSGPVRPDAFVALFEPGDATDAATAEVRAALAAEEQPALAPPRPAPVAPTQPPPRADEIHTAIGYRKLLQNNGPKGSGETEHMHVHPAPWPSVERVCADAFALLSPGGGPMPRGLFMAKLCEAGKELCVEKYDTHVRRAVAVLGLSNAILEDDGRVTLHPEVADAGDIRWAVLGVMLRLLAVRLEEKGVAEQIRPEAFVAAIEAGPLTDQMVPEIALAIESMYQPADATEVAPVEDAVTPTPEAVPAADDDVVLVPPATDENEQVDAVEEDTDERESDPEAAEVEPAPDNEGAAAEGRTPGYGPDKRPAPFEVRAEQEEWDPFAFDAVLPEFASPTPTPAAAPRPDPHTEADEPDAIDVSAITSEAVAAVVEPAEPDVLPPLEVTPSAVAPAPGTPPPADELPRARHVGGWAPDDDDALFSDPDGGVERITERLTGSSTQLGKHLAPRSTVAPVDDEDALFSDPDGGVERITERLTGSSARLAPRLPPAARQPRVTRIPTPPPSPPLPPESA